MLIGGMPAIRLAIAEDVVGVGHRGDARRQRGGIGDLGKRHHETVEIVVVVLSSSGRATASGHRARRPQPKLGRYFPGAELL